MYPDIDGLPLDGATGLDAHMGVGDGMSGGASSRRRRGHGVRRSTGRRVKRGSKTVRRTNGRRTKGRRPKVHKSRRRR